MKATFAKVIDYFQRRDKKIVAIISFLLFVITAYFAFGNDHFLSISLALALHELLHLLAIKALKLTPRWMIFIPLLGGAVGCTSPRGIVTEKEHALVALAAPVAGLSLCYTFFINLIFSLYFNFTVEDQYLLSFFTYLYIISTISLLPFYPFDGGQALSIVLSGASKKLRTILLSSFFMFTVALTIWLSGKLPIGAYPIIALSVFALYRHIKRLPNLQSSSCSLPFRIALLFTLFFYLTTAIILPFNAFHLIKDMNKKPPQQIIVQ